MSDHSTSTFMDESIKFFIDVLYSKIPDWSEYDSVDLDKLLDIVDVYPFKLPSEYEDKFQEIKKEFLRKKQ